MLAPRVIGLWCLIVAAWAMPPRVHAQAEADDLGVFFDLAATETAANPPVNVLFEFWITGFDLQDIFAFEVYVSTPPEVVVMSAIIVDNPNTGCNLSCRPPNWIVGLGGCFDGTGVHPLLRYTAYNFTAGLTDAAICVEAARPSTFSPPTPGYMACTEELIPFGVAENGQGIYPDGCAVLYPTQQIPIATDVASWSTVKSRFAARGPSKE